MKEIIFSKLDPQKVTYTMDSFLNLRDEYLFATLFNGCRKGYIPGAEFERMRKLRKEPIVNAVLWIFRTALIVFALKMILFPAELRDAVLEAIYIIAGCGLLYLIFMSSRSISFRDRWKDDISINRKIAEACEGNNSHLMSRPVFYGKAMIRAKKQIRAAGKDVQRAEEPPIAELLYSYALQLYDLQRLAAISKEIREFVDQCGIEFVELELKEDMGKAWKPIYQLVITAKLPEVEDTVIPMETDVKTKTFELPYTVGREIKLKHGRKKRMDLSVMDDSYYAFKREFAKHKSEIMRMMQKKKPEEKAAVKNAIDLVKF